MSTHRRRKCDCGFVMPVRDMLKITLLILGLYVSVNGTELSCTSDGVVELEENKTDNIVTCSEIGGPTVAVQWYVDFPDNNNSISVGSCVSVNNCIGQPGAGFSVSRPSSDVSEMVVDATRVPSYMFGNVLACIGATRDSCRIDHIHRPDVSVCNVTFINPRDSPWSVSSRCDVTMAYSLRERYNCQWMQQRESQAETTLGSAVNMTRTSMNGKYINGFCQVTSSFPAAEGRYSYSVIISPGLLRHSAVVSGTNVIRHPSPSHNCPDYVTDDQSVTCTCGGDVGSPPGVAQWSSTMTSELIVTSSMAEQSQTCQVIYNNGVVSDNPYTVTRAYGPDRVTITGPSPFDTDGSQTLTLDCSVPGGSVPTSTFTWRHGSEVKGHTYHFQPQVQDDRMQVTCQARNTFSNVTVTAAFTIHLNYPPTTDPIITNSSTDGQLYKGDTVTFTCGVTGGKPLNATTLNFICPGKPDTGDNQESAGVSSIVTFDPLTDSDHDKECTCSTSWKRTQWYNRNITSRLFVNTPPSTPNISGPSGSYPFLATVTQSATLTCDSSTPGRPSATYTWPVNQGGRQGTDARGRGTLTFDTVSKEHDGKRVSCRASNRYTDNRQSVPDGSLVLEVYYHPDVHIVAVSDVNPNQCQILTSDTPQCVVSEGERVHFQCGATSNPAPAVITWTSGNENDTDFYIPAANHTQHTGTYNCSVKTGGGNHGNDSRLPLRNNSVLTVLVTYGTSISNFTINSTTTNLTVNVTDTVTLACRAEGRPSPEMTLFSPNQTALATISQGTPSLVDTVAEVTFRDTAQCRGTGEYTCDVSNGVGSRQRQKITVFVRCKPEPLLGDSEEEGRKIPSVNFVTKPVSLSFYLAAYPTPQLRHVTFSHQRPNATSDGQPVTGSKIDVTCSRHTDMLFNVTCVVTLDNIKSTDRGFYRAVIGNNLGDQALLFEVTVNATSNEPSFPVAAVVGGGIFGLLVVGGIAAFLTFWKRRKGTKKETASSDVTIEASGENDEVMIVNDIYGTSESKSTGDQQRGAQQPNPYEDVDVTNAKPAIQPKPKLNKQVADPSPVGNCDVYAQVIKEKKDSNPSSSASAKPAMGKSENAAKSGLAKISSRKATTGNGARKSKTKNDDKQPLQHGEGSVYANSAPLTMSPIQDHATVYENYAFNPDRDDNEDDKDAADSQTVNPDGLIYSKIAFSDRQKRKAEQPPPERENTEYADIDFTKHLPS